MRTHTDQAFISSHYSRMLARELRLHEPDLPKLLEGTDLPTSVLLPGDETRLSGPQQLRIMRNARILDPDPELGLRLGSQLDPSAHGPIGYLAQSSPDLITALRALRDFLPLRIAIAQLGLEVSGPWLRCTLQVRLAAPEEERRMLLECFALLLQALIESVLGKPLAAGRFEFEFGPPAYRKAYRDYFHCPTRFSRAQSQLLLPSGLAGAANAAADPGSYGLARTLAVDDRPGAAQAVVDARRARQRRGCGEGTVRFQAYSRPPPHPGGQRLPPDKG